MKKNDRNLQNLKQMLILLDAESSDVRDKVRSELLQWGDDLEHFIHHPNITWAPEQLFWLHEITHLQQRQQTRQGWLAWLKHSDPLRQLETGFATLAQLQSDIQIAEPLPHLLDDLCDRYLAFEVEPSAFSLNRFLFVDGNLKGATDDYYHPQHSHLPYVIAHGSGLPLSLAVIFMLVGYRLDLNILGFNLPGHFLTRTSRKETLHFFDCFNRGKLLKQHEIFSLAISPQVPFEQLLKHPPSPVTMVMRALINLIHAYQRIGDHRQFHFMQDLLADLYQHARQDQPAAISSPSKDQPILACGQLVRHKRYDYRGVVVDFDLTCQAEEAWYRSNLSQPDKNQPWYHVLVDQSESTTYAAQSSLEPDRSRSAINHPLIPIYFHQFKDGQYQRNQVPWNLELP